MNVYVRDIKTGKYFVADVQIRFDGTSSAELNPKALDAPPADTVFGGVVKIDFENNSLEFLAPLKATN